MPGLRYLVIIEAPGKIGKIRGFVETMRRNRAPDNPDIGGPGDWDLIATGGHFRSILPGTPYTEPPGREVWMVPGRLRERGARGERPEVERTSFLGEQISEFLTHNPAADRVHHFRFSAPQAVRRQLRNPDPEYNPARYLAVAAPTPADAQVPAEVRRRRPYTPWYLTINEQTWGALVAAGRRLTPDAVVYIATDDDPEGEAIGWHAATAVRQAAPASVQWRRVRYHEITFGAVREGFRQADAGDRLDDGMLAQQQAREKLDRLFGYTASRALWFLDGGKNEPALRGLSLGRVQIAALLLLLEDEETALQQLPSFSYAINTLCHVQGGSFAAGFKSNQPFAGFSTPQQLVDQLTATPGRVASVSLEPKTWTRPMPFSLSTLQQEMLSVYRVTASNTLNAVQALYSMGLSTYPRTDSDRISGDGLRYLYDTAQQLGLPAIDPFVAGQGVRSRGPAAHGAHEAIRPAQGEGARIWLAWYGQSGARQMQDLVRALPSPGRGGVGAGVQPLLLARVYDMIWRRSLAVLLPEGRTESTLVRVSHPALGDNLLVSRAMRWVDQGYFAVWTLTTPSITGPMPPVTQGESVRIETRPERITVSVRAAKRPRAQGLNAQLTRMGIGTPATIGTLLDTLEERGYVAGERAAEGGMSRFGAFVAAFARQSYRGTLGIATTAEMDAGLKQLREARSPEQDQIRLLDRFWNRVYMSQLASSRQDAWRLGGGDPDWPGLDRAGNFLRDVRGRLRGIHGIEAGSDPAIEAVIRAGVRLSTGTMVPAQAWQTYGSLRFIPSRHDAERGAVLMVWRSGGKAREYVVRLQYFYPDPTWDEKNRRRTLMFSALAGEDRLAATVAAVIEGVGQPLRREGPSLASPMEAWRYLATARLRVLQAMPTILVDSDGFFADMRAARGLHAVWTLIDRPAALTEALQSGDEDEQ